MLNKPARVKRSMRLSPTKPRDAVIERPIRPPAVLRSYRKAAIEGSGGQPRYVRRHERVGEKRHNSEPLAELENHPEITQYIP